MRPTDSTSITARARDASGNTASADVSVTVSNAAQPAGLVLALGFDETTGAAVTDASGQGNHGTISGATRTTAGRFGGALSFDGINDWVTVADAASLDLTNRLTVEAWVFPTALNSWETVVLKEAGRRSWSTACMATTMPGGPAPGCASAARRPPRSVRRPCRSTPGRTWR